MDTKFCITAFTSQISPYHFLFKGFAVMLLCMVWKKCRISSGVVFCDPLADTGVSNAIFQYDISQRQYSLQILMDSSEFLFL